MQPTSSQTPPLHQRYDNDEPAGTPLLFELVQGQLRCVEPVLLTKDEVDRMAVEAEEELHSRIEAKVGAKSEARMKAKEEAEVQTKADAQAKAKADAEAQAKEEAQVQY